MLNAGKLRAITTPKDLTPKPRNVTRWSSTYSMIVRYLEIIEYGEAIKTIDTRTGIDKNGNPQ